MVSWYCYCWWKKSCTSSCGKSPIVCRVLYIPGGARFLPSTVSFRSTNLLYMDLICSPPFGFTHAFHFWYKKLEAAQNFWKQHNFYLNKHVFFGFILDFKLLEVSDLILVGIHSNIWGTLLVYDEQIFPWPCGEVHGFLWGESQWNGWNVMQQKSMSLPFNTGTIPIYYTYAGMIEDRHSEIPLF